MLNTSYVRKMDGTGQVIESRIEGVNQNGLDSKMSVDQMKADHSNYDKNGNVYHVNNGGDDAECDDGNYDLDDKDDDDIYDGDDEGIAQDDNGNDVRDDEDDGNDQDDREDDNENDNQNDNDDERTYGDDDGDDDDVDDKSNGGNDDGNDEDDNNNGDDGDDGTEGEVGSNDGDNDGDDVGDEPDKSDGNGKADDADDEDNADDEEATIKVYNINIYGGNDKDKADVMGYDNADDRMDDRGDEGDVIGIDDKNADAMVEDKNSMGEGHTSYIEMLDVVVIVANTEETNPEIVTDKISDDEMQNLYTSAEANYNTGGGDNQYSNENTNNCSNISSSNAISIQCRVEQNNIKNAVPAENQA